MARQRAAGPDAPPAFWTTADEQTAGRGRLGRRWTSEPGNLYATLALRDPAPAPHLPTLSLAAAVAVRRAVLDAAGDPALAAALRLKWPNDVLLHGAKVAGILLEAFDVGGVRWVAIGCGVNCAHHPPDAAYPATDLAAQGLAVTPDNLFAALDGRMRDTLAVWDEGRGFERLGAEWMECAHGLNAAATVRAPSGTLAGTMRGLAPDGRLLLETENGIVEVSAGDVAPPKDASD